MTLRSPGAVTTAASGDLGPVMARTSNAAELQDAEAFLKVISEIEVSNPPQGEDLSPLTDVSDKERSA